MERLERRSKKDQEKKSKNSKVVEITNKNSIKKDFFYAYDEEISAAGSPIQSPRDVFDVPISGTDSDSTGSSSSSSSTPQRVQNGGRSSGGGVVEGGHQWRNMIDALRIKSVRRFSSIPLLAASYEISRKNLRNKLARVRTDNDDENGFDCSLDLDGIPTKPTWRNFSYEDLVAATDNFNPGN